MAWLTAMGQRGRFVIIGKVIDDSVKTHKTFWNLMGKAPNEKYTTEVLKITPCIGTPAFFIIL